MIVAGGKMALTRKANPLIDVGSGLVDHRRHLRGRRPAAHAAAARG